MESARIHLVDLFDVDPALAEGLPAAAARNANQHVQVFEVRRGDWSPMVPDHVLALVVLAGFVTKRVEVAGRHSVELLGPGDILRPFEEDDEFAMVPTTTSWRVLAELQVAVLDESFAQFGACHPSLLGTFMSRMLQRSRTLSLRLALDQLPRLSARLNYLLWHLADRFGRVQSDGVRLAVPLSHAILADLVSAQRPSVSRAMKDLECRGLVVPEGRGHWLLRDRPPSQLE